MRASKVKGLISQSTCALAALPFGLAGDPKTSGLKRGLWVGSGRFLTPKMPWEFSGFRFYTILRLSLLMFHPFRILWWSTWCDSTTWAETTWGNGCPHLIRSSSGHHRMWSPIHPISNLVDLVDLEGAEGGVDESYVDISPASADSAGSA